jgi:proline racemase
MLDVQSVDAPDAVLWWPSRNVLLLIAMHPNLLRQEHMLPSRSLSWRLCAIVRPRCVVMARGALMQRCCTSRIVFAASNAAASHGLYTMCSVNVACDHGFVGSIDRAQTSLRQCCSV